MMNNINKKINMLVPHVDMITGLNIKNQKIQNKKLLITKKVEINQKLKVNQNLKIIMIMIVMMMKSQNNYINILKNMKNKKKLGILSIMLNKIFNYHIK